MLEGICRASFDAAGGYVYLGTGLADAELDGIYQIGSEKVGLEAKNVREWIYPMSGEVWEMVQKCLQLDTLPMLVTRKTAFQAKVFFEALGITHFDVFRQYFSRSVAQYLKDIQHTDLLGYKDVLAVDIAPNPHLVNYLKNTLPPNLAARRAVWNARRDIIEEFAIGHNLGDRNMRDQQRHRYYPALREALFPRAPEEGDGDYPDDDPGENEWTGG